MRSMRRAAVLAASASLVCAVACIDFRHTNPFDPIVPVTVTIIPETLFSVAGKVVQFSFAAVPPFTDPRAIWSVGSTDLYTTDGTGLLYSAAAPLWPKTDTIPIAIGIGLHALNNPFVTFSDSLTRTLNGSVIVTQRLVRIRARCAGALACDSLPVGATASVFIDGFDALGSGLSGLPDSTANPLTALPIFVFTVRDTTIATALPVGMRAATVTAKGVGSTWIVAQRDSLRDSLRITIR
jgi:hypothetical protein